METETDTNGSVKLTHGHGIDNDNAFSTGVDLEGEIKKRKGFSTRLCMVVDSKDNLVIPHIDEQLAENILNLSPDEIEIAVKDLIEPQFIPYLLKRFQKVKNAIQKEKSKNEESKIVKDNDWNEKTHHDFMKNTRFYKEVLLPLQEQGIVGTDQRYRKVLAQIGREQDADKIYDAMKEDSYYSLLIIKLMGTSIGAGSNESHGIIDTISGSSSEYNYSA